MNGENYTLFENFLVIIKKMRSNNFNNPKARGQHHLQK